MDDFGSGDGHASPITVIFVAGSFAGAVNIGLASNIFIRFGCELGSPGFTTGYAICKGNVERCISVCVGGLLKVGGMMSRSDKSELRVSDSVKSLGAF